MANWEDRGPRPAWASITFARCHERAGRYRLASHCWAEAAARFEAHGDDYQAAWAQGQVLRLADLRALAVAEA